MKQILMFLLFLNCSCANAQEVETEKLVKQLQVLKAAVLAEDPQTIASFFQFPVKDKNLKTKLEWNKKDAATMKKVSRHDFVKHYHHLFTPEVVEMFRQLDFDKLNQQAELIVEVPPKSKTEKCSRTYELVFLNNQVMLSYVTNTRRDVQLSDDDVCEEYAEFWQFNWVAGQLRFHSLEMAG